MNTSSKNRSKKNDLYGEPLTRSRHADMYHSRERNRADEELRPQTKQNKKRGAKAYEDEGLFGYEDSDKFEALVIQDWKVQGSPNAANRKNKKLVINRNPMNDQIKQSN